MKANKGLSDRELVEKYEAGAIHLAKELKKSFKEYSPLKRVVTEREGKKK